MNFYDEFKSGKWIPYTIAVCSGVILYFLLSNLSILGVIVGSIWRLLFPLLMGVIIAYLIDPLVKFFEEKNIKRKPSVLFALLVILVVAFLMVYALVPQLMAGILQFVENIGSYIKSLEVQIIEMNSALSSEGNNVSAMSDSIVKLLDTISAYVAGHDIVSTSSNIGSGVTTFAVSFILAVYYLMDKEAMVEWVQRFLQKILKEQRYNNLAQFCSRCNRILLSYITCSIAEAGIVGVVNCLFMIIFRMPYAVLISFIVAITNLAPTFGPIVGCIIGMFILLLVKPSAVIGFLIFTLILQTIDGYVIKPKLFGNTLGVSSLLILIFLILGGRLFGITGILLSIPAAAILQYFFQEILYPYAQETKRRAEEEREDKQDIVVKEIELK